MTIVKEGTLKKVDCFEHHSLMFESFPVSSNKRPHPRQKHRNGLIRSAKVKSLVGGNFYGHYVSLVHENCRLRHL